ncbi:uncharacterized protein LOC123519063 [Portunus trituberculatus]|uniref:uncharacterized protein LOC123519063 n=1 Tax=Portunus trituberculatus TaxID=210409 RepID=UPI001E1D1571|nr:uncharacterized protein LOC123519063 [Portunus trituberculatus]
MAIGRWSPAIRLTHGCLTHLGLRPSNILCPTDDTKQDRRSFPSGNEDVCEVKRRLACVKFSHVLKKRLNACPQRHRVPMTKVTISGGHATHRSLRCGKGSSEYRFWERKRSCQELHSVLSGVKGPAGKTSTHHHDLDNCYDTTKSVICTTTNHQCRSGRARDSTFITQRRSGRQNKLSGHYVVAKAHGGGASLEMRTMLVVVAMVVGSCHALPTLPPHISSSRAPQIDHQPPRKELPVCCGEGTQGMRPTNITVLRTSPTSVLVTWTRPSIQPVKYEITYKPTNAKYRVVAEVKAPLKSVVLERLLPLTQYQVFVTTVINNTAVWRSPVVTFHTSIEDINAPVNGTVRIFSTPTILEGVDVDLDEVGSTVTTDRKMGHVRVRAEEVGIVLLVLAVWMFAIALFFNRWGKIRMLEPYQEPYKEAPQQLLQHRPSCPMADPCALPINSLKRPSLTHSQLEHHMSHRRPRQNSVFVGRSSRSHSLEVHPPRRVKSALNLTTLVLQESEEEGAVATTFT